MNDFHEKVLIAQDNTIGISIRTTIKAIGIILSFSHLNWNEFRSHGFSESYWIKKGYSVISFQSTVNDWFNSISKKYIQKINEYLYDYKHLPIITYGASMGGFAALAFRNEFNATHAIAFSPQFSTKMPFDTRWQDCFDGNHIHGIYKRPDDNCSCLIIFDPFSKDSLHVLEIQNRINKLTLLKLPNAGHHVSAALNELDLLDGCQSMFLAGIDIQDYSRKFKQNRLRSSSFLLSLGWKLGSRRRSYATCARYVISLTNNKNDEYKKLDKALSIRFNDYTNYSQELEDKGFKKIASNNSIYNCINDENRTITSKGEVENNKIDITCESHGSFYLDITKPTLEKRFFFISITGSSFHNQTHKVVIDLTRGFAFCESQQIYAAIYETFIRIGFTAKYEGVVSINLTQHTTHFKIYPAP